MIKRETMIKRSRGGCIVCKRSKVKCDELRPTCGTCARRGHACQGYNDAKPLQWQRVETSDALARRKKKNTSDGVVATNANGAPPSRSFSPQQASTFQPSPVQWKTLADFPHGVLSPAEELVINLYFNRHPPELVMNREGEFVNEMNANVLLVLSRNPQAVCDTLFCIGQIYIQQSGNGSIVPALDRRGRTLARLQKMNLNHDLEQTITLILGLCAMDLIDSKYAPMDSVIPPLHAYGAMRIHRHIEAGLEFSSIAKYFIRALARQEMIAALSHRRRILIPTSVWLDEECKRSADRFMGFTVTLMPLLEELCSLAEDLRGNFIENVELVEGLESSELNLTTDPLDLLQSNSYLDRAADLRARIESWRPMATQTTFIKSHKKFLYQACAHRSAALLYLHRLLYPAGSSLEADGVALSMACEILAYLQAPPEEIRTSLWPAFVASAELINDEDRTTALEVFESMYSSRKTTTTLRTKEFIVDRVWKARDSGEEWSWMLLMDRYPAECLPI